MLPSFKDILIVLGIIYITILAIALPTYYFAAPNPTLFGAFAIGFASTTMGAIGATAFVAATKLNILDISLQNSTLSQLKTLRKSRDADKIIQQKKAAQLLKGVSFLSEGEIKACLSSGNNYLIREMFKILTPTNLKSSNALKLTANLGDDQNFLTLLTKLFEDDKKIITQDRDMREHFLELVKKFIANCTKPDFRCPISRSVIKESVISFINKDGITIYLEEKNLEKFLRKHTYITDTKGNIVEPMQYCIPDQKYINNLSAVNYILANHGKIAGMILTLTTGSDSLYSRFHEAVEKYNSNKIEKKDGSKITRTESDLATAKSLGADAAERRAKANITNVEHEETPKTESISGAKESSSVNRRAAELREAAARRLSSQQQEEETGQDYSL